ncbi:hypothetical protein GJ496_005602 [Pomphorhynchus laevis]|nr:hypothetical protein GJ496_005602 [Pomphorhynchus laevis]
MRFVTPSHSSKPQYALCMKNVLNCTYQFLNRRNEICSKEATIKTTLNTHQIIPFCCMNTCMETRLAMEQMFAVNDGVTSKNLFYPKRATLTVPRPSLCGQCMRAVYAAETASAAGKKFHKLCLKCVKCSRLLDSTTLTEHRDKLFCHSCYSKYFGLEALRATSTLSLSNSNMDNDVPNRTLTKYRDSTYKYSMLKTPSASVTKLIDYSNERRVSSVAKKLINAQNDIICPRCRKKVFMAEKVMAAGQAFHKLCFICGICSSSLNSGNYCDNSKGEIFCKACYTKNFGPVGICR